jgi:hypothetical protein
MKVNGTSVRSTVTLLVLGISLLTIPSSLEAQKSAGISRVGWLEVCSPGPKRPHFDIFRAHLAELGYVEGKNLVIEQRFADCHYDRMPGLATELVQAPVDVLFTMGTRAARIVAATVKTTPVVVYSCDPFEHVTRLARPGHDPEAAPNALKMTQDVAPRLGVTLQEAKVGAAEELLPELAAVAEEHPDALFIYPDVVLSSYPRPQQLADFAIKAHLPTINAFRFFTDAGGLMSYGATASKFIRTRPSKSHKS